MNIILLAISAALVNNVILSQFMGICPFLGVSKKVSTAAGMGGAVIFVMTIASAVTSVIYHFVLVPLKLSICTVPLVNGRRSIFLSLLCAP